MSDHTDPRHTARAIALQQLFTQLIAEAQPFANEDLLQILETGDYDQPLAEKIVAGVPVSLPEIDPVIETLAPAWPIKQIAPVDLIILRMGIWEAFVARVTPARVVINEAIELAKEFGGPSSSGFINGVLGALLNRDDLQKQLNADYVPGQETEVKSEVPNSELSKVEDGESNQPGAEAAD